MVIALPADGENIQISLLLQDRLAVFHSQNIVGTGKNIRIRAHSGQSGLAGGREGKSLVQLLTEQWREFFGKKGAGSVQQTIFVCSFRAEADCVTNFAQYSHTPGGKTFRRRQRGCDGKFQNKIRTGQDCGLGPEGFVHNGRVTTLDKISAHCADDSSVRTEMFPNTADLFGVSPMEGIIFANDTNGFQKNPSQF